MLARNNGKGQIDIYSEYYRICGIWWGKWADALAPLKGDHLNRKRGEAEFLSGLQR